MKHPVVIITSHPNEMLGAVRKLEAMGFEVKVLDSLSANLVDFFGAISGEPVILDNPPKPDEADEADGIEQSTDELDPNADLDDATNDVGDTQSTDPTIDAESSTDETTMQGTVNDIPVTVQEVEGDTITLHPVSNDGSDSKGKVTFSLTESVIFKLWEEEKEKASDGQVVNVQITIEELNIDGMFDVEISTLTMNPPTLMVGTDWIANNISTDTGE